MKNQMKTNLIYFKPKSNLEKRAISLTLPAFSYGSMCDIVCSSELSDRADVSDLKSLLFTNSVIALDFSDDEKFEKVQKAVTSAFRTAIQNTNFGGFCEANGKSCAIINVGKNPSIDVEKLHELYKVHPSVCLKLWGITVPEIEEKCSEINNFSSLNHIICDSFGDITLAIESCVDSFLTQELYQRLAPYIYYEEFRSLFDCVVELVSVRKREFGILDFAGGEVLAELQSSQEVKPFLVNLANLGATKTTTLEELKMLVARRKLSFATILVPRKDGYKVIFIDEEIHSFDVEALDLSSGIEYLKNFVYNKMLNKLKKNVLY